MSKHSKLMNFLSGMPDFVFDYIEIAVKVRQSFEFRDKSKQFLENAKQAVELAIEQGEDAALAWLKDKVE